MRGLYSVERHGTFVPGIIFAPVVGIFCAYPNDGNSMSKRCDVPGGGEGSVYTMLPDENANGAPCVPGCPPDGQWCDQPGVKKRFSCSYPPEDLCGFLRRWETRPPKERTTYGKRITEVVVDARSVAADPVASVDGFFMMEGATTNADARAAHARFIATYQLDPETTAPPLVWLDPAAELPFRLAQR